MSAAGVPWRRRWPWWGAALLLLQLALPLPAAELAELQAALQAGEHREVVEEAAALTRREPAGAENWRVYAEALEATGAYDEALAAYQRVTELASEPDYLAEVAAARLEALLGYAVLAERRMRRLVEAGGMDAANSAPELIALGHAYRHLAERDPALDRLALASYEAAIARDPGDPQAQVAMGELLLQRYNNTEALEAFRAALAIDPDYLPARLGLARSQLFDYSSEAEQTLRSILQRDAGHLPARVLLARLLIDSEDYARAESELHGALAVNLYSPEALTAMAALRYLQGDRHRFDALAAEVRRIAPGYVSLYLTLSEFAARNRRYGDALRFAAEAVELRSSAWRGHALMGENLLRLGRMEAGRRSLELSFRGDPYDVRTKNTLDLLDRLDGFEQIASARFVLVAAAGEARVLAPRLLPIAEQAYDYFAERYGIRPATPIRIEVYSRHEDFSVRTVGLVGVDIVGVSFGPVIALDSPSAGAFGPFNWASAVWHELAHSFHLALTESRVPRWFTEGLSVHEERLARAGWGMDVSPGFLNAFEDGRLAPASDLNQAFLRPSYPDQIPHAYYQASLIMAFIEARLGFAGIARMLRGFAAGHSAAEMIVEHLGMTPETFDAQFEAFVRQRFQPPLADPAAADGEPGLARYQALLRQAREAAEGGALERAQDMLESAVALFPAHAGAQSAYRLLAEVQQRRGQAQAAIATLETVLAIDADDLAAHEALARLYQAQDDAPNLARTLERALLIQPFDPELHRRLADALEATGQWPAAVPARTAVLDLEPADPAGARYALARALSRAEAPQEARRQLLLALEQAPLYEEALALLLEVREQLQRPPGAPGTEVPVTEPAVPAGGEPRPTGVQ